MTQSLLKIFFCHEHWEGQKFFEIALDFLPFRHFSQKRSLHVCSRSITLYFSRYSMHAPWKITTNFEEMLQAWTSSWRQHLTFHVTKCSSFMATSTLFGVAIREASSVAEITVFWNMLVWFLADISHSSMHHQALFLWEKIGVLSGAHQVFSKFVRFLGLVTENACFHVLEIWHGPRQQTHGAQQTHRVHLETLVSVNREALPVNG